MIYVKRSLVVLLWALIIPISPVLMLMWPLFLAYHYIRYGELPNDD